MSPKEEEQLLQRFASIVGELLNERRVLSEAQHKIHHDFIQTLVDKERRIQARKERVLTNFLGIAAVATAFSFVGAIGVWVRSLLLKG